MGRRGNDPGLAPTFRVWGYDTCWGSMAQFTKVQAHQCLPKAEALTWEEAAAPTLTGATAYRMLHGWPPNTVQPGDVVLVWGGAGGLGSLAIQLVSLAGGRAVAVVSSKEKAEHCIELGAVGTVEPDAVLALGRAAGVGLAGWKAWFDGAKAFGKAIWEAVGEKASPRIVFEHPGQDTIPTSNFVCDRGGMIVICAGTTGYDTMIDVRYLWYLQKRYQGSHLFNDEQAAAFNDLVRAGKVRATLGQTYRYEEAGLAHQLMGDGKLPEGNVAVLVNAPAPARPGSTSRAWTSSIEDAAHVLRVDERDQRVPRPAPRHLVHQPHPLVPQSGERRRDVVDPVRHVMQAGAARRRGTSRPASPHRAHPSNWMLDVPDREQDLLHTLIIHAFPMGGLDAERPPVATRRTSPGPSTAIPTWWMSRITASSASPAASARSGPARPPRGTAEVPGLGRPPRCLGREGPRRPSPRRDGERGARRTPPGRGTGPARG